MEILFFCFCFDKNRFQFKSNQSKANQKIKAIQFISNSTNIQFKANQIKFNQIKKFPREFHNVFFEFLVDFVTTSITSGDIFKNKINLI